MTFAQQILRQTSEMHVKMNAWSIKVIKSVGNPAKKKTFSDLMKRKQNNDSQIEYDEKKFVENESQLLDLKSASVLETL